MSLKKWIVYGFLGLTILAGVGATVWTLIPDASARTNFWGTKTHCPFVPYSTYGSIAVAVVGTILFLIAWRFWK